MNDADGEARLFGVVLDEVPDQQVCIKADHAASPSDVREEVSVIDKR